MMILPILSFPSVEYDIFCILYVSIILFWRYPIEAIQIGNKKWVTDGF